MSPSNASSRSTVAKLIGPAGLSWRAGPGYDGPADRDIGLVFLGDAEHGPHPLGERRHLAALAERRAAPPQHPHSGSSPAKRASSIARRVLPTPASPVTTTDAGLRRFDDVEHPPDQPAELRVAADERGFFTQP